MVRRSHDLGPQSEKIMVVVESHYLGMYEGWNPPKAHSIVKLKY